MLIWHILMFLFSALMRFLQGPPSSTKLIRFIAKEEISNLLDERRPMAMGVTRSM